MAAKPPSSSVSVADLTGRVNELKISQAKPVKAKQEHQVASASPLKADDGKGDVVRKEFSVFCWNIDGNDSKVTATLRKPVTLATFKDVVGDDRSMDVICLQELKFKGKNTYTRYFEIPLDEYGYEFTEESRGHYDSILFKEDKFEQLELKDCSTFKEAFQLMDLKKKFYEEISKKFYQKIPKNEAAEMSVSEKDYILKKMKFDKKSTTTQKSLCDEIQSECNSVKDFASIKSEILPRYQTIKKKKVEKKKVEKGKVDKVDESLEDFVKRRAAMVLVKLKSQKLDILVISVHSPKQAPKDEEESVGSRESVATRFAYLLFDFLDKFGLIANENGSNMCVVIAGDFNTDIKKTKCYEQFVQNKYDCPEYALQEVRKSCKNDGASVLQKIDFMLFRNFSPDHTADLKDVASPPTITPDSVRQKLRQDKTPIEQERSVSNHPPLTGTVQVETAKKKLFPPIQRSEKIPEL